MTKAVLDKRPRVSHDELAEANLDSRNAKALVMANRLQRSHSPQYFCRAVLRNGVVLTSMVGLVPHMRWGKPNVTKQSLGDAEGRISPPVSFQPTCFQQSTEPQPETAENDSILMGLEKSRRRRLAMVRRYEKQMDEDFEAWLDG